MEMEIGKDFDFQSMAAGVPQFKADLGKLLTNNYNLTQLNKGDTHSHVLKVYSKQDKTYNFEKYISFNKVSNGKGDFIFRMDTLKENHNDRFDFEITENKISENKTTENILTERPSSLKEVLVALVGSLRNKANL